MALNLVIAAIVFWNTPYMDKATDHLGVTGQMPDPGLLPFTSPLGWEHIILTGNFDWHSGAAERKIARPMYLSSSRRSAAWAQNRVFARCSSLAWFYVQTSACQKIH